MNLTPPPDISHIKAGPKIRQTKPPGPSRPDQFYRLKYMGYCLSQLPPDGIPTTISDYVEYAKFHLCVDKHVLMEDPIWDKYSDEMILVEFFANLFSKSKEKLQEFQATLKGTTTVDEFNDWADRMIAKNKIELEEKAKALELEDSVHFSPDSLGE
jgi:hypothetical protein